MSQGGVSERILFLRRSLAAIEARSGAQKAPASPRPAEAPPRDPFGRLLEALKAGGFAEIAPARPRDGGAAAGFAFALALRCGLAHARLGVWIAEDMVTAEIGLPYGRGLATLGLDPRRLVLVRSRRPDETLWALEEALKGRGASVLAETWMAPRAYDLTTSRRLLLAARRGGGTGLLLLPRAAGAASRLSSAAHVRFEVASIPVSRPVARPAARLLPLPGPLAWRLRIVKTRASLMGACGDFDPSEWRDISFDPENGDFCHAFPQRLPAPPFDRPDFARLRDSA
jgi:protein ImuA